MDALVAVMNSRCSMVQLGGQLVLLLVMHRLLRINVYLLALVMEAFRSVIQLLQCAPEIES